MHKIIGLAVAAALSVGTVAATTTEASAATGSVTIKKIASKKVKYNKSTTIKPRVSKTGNVKYASRKITVKKSRKTVAKNRTSVRLKAGTYRVTTTVKYRTWRKASRLVPVQQVVFPAGSSVPVTCVIETVSDPASTTTTSYDERCTGDFRGYLLHTGSAEYDANAGEWSLGTGESISGGAAQDLVGHSHTASVVTSNDLMKTVKVAELYTKWSSLRKKARTQTLTIKQGKKPTSMIPDGWDCPSWAPIKGNASSMIYHVPSGAFYDRTNPEICFSTEAAAKAAGYRKSKV